jgi:L-serine/L-threonine ammonia-lyase
MILDEGAELIVHGDSWMEAHGHALSMVGANDAMLHPFDDPLLWPGHATMIDEAARQGTKPDVVVLSVGGGGLLCGVVEGLRRNDWGDVPIVAVETEGAASLHAAIEAGERVTLDAITSIATSLGAKQVSEQTFRLAHEHRVISVVVSDAAAVAACMRFIDDHRIVVEPACGAALAVAYDRAEQLDPFERVLMIVCGGATASVTQLEAWSASLQR